MKLLEFFLVLLLSLMAGMSCVHAEKADRDKPMNIEADAMRHDESQQLTVFTGNVQAIKGTLVLRAARMDVRQDNQGRQQAHLTALPGARVFFRQKREGLDEFMEGEAELVDYDSQSDTLILTRNAEMRTLRGQQLAHQVQGQKIVFNNLTEVFTVDGQTPGARSRDQRVKAILAPSASASTPAAAAPAAALKTSPRLQ